MAYVVKVIIKRHSGSIINYCRKACILSNFARLILFVHRDVLFASLFASIIVYYWLVLSISFPPIGDEGHRSLFGIA